MRYGETEKDLMYRGVSIFDGEYIDSTGDHNSGPEEFTAYWNDLEPDRFMQDDGLYRKRRFGRYLYNQESASLVAIEGDLDFYQSKEINQVNGGKSRKFAPVSEDFAKNEFLTKIVRGCLKIIAVRKPHYTTLIINTHLIRIICGPSFVGLPTPEGIHSDGHCFVSQHLIKRQNVYGGVSGIYDRNNEPVAHHQLNKFMDSILLEDSVVKHDVSPVFSADKKSEGYRDMLIIDYNFT